MGSTLAGREDGGVDSGLEVGLLVLSEEDQTGSGSSKGLVAGKNTRKNRSSLKKRRLYVDVKKDSRGGGHDVTVVERRALGLTSDETRDVGHVTEQVRALLVGDRPEGLVVPVSGVGGRTAHEQPGLEQVGVRGEGLHVDQTGLVLDLVRQRLEVDRRSGHLLLGGLHVPVW